MCHGQNMYAAYTYRMTSHYNLFLLLRNTRIADGRGYDLNLNS